MKANHLNPDRLIHAAVELGKFNERAAEIAQHLLRQRQIRKSQPMKRGRR